MLRVLAITYSPWDSIDGLGGKQKHQKHHKRQKSNPGAQHQHQAGLVEKAITRISTEGSSHERMM